MPAFSALPGDVIFKIIGVVNGGHLPSSSSAKAYWPRLPPFPGSMAVRSKGKKVPFQPVGHIVRKLRNTIIDRWLWVLIMPG